MTDKKLRGFQLWSAEKRREVASRGGKRAHEMGVAHEFTTEQAKAAGRKGGMAPHVRYGGRPRTAA